jgi:serine O-acetyltransferase
LHNNKNKNIFQWLSYFIVRMKYRRLSLKLGFSIPINVFGPGLSIPHYGTIVVSKFARIGSNCRIHVGVNIGASAGEAKAPQLGHNIYIGPGAILFGDIS